MDCAADDWVPSDACAAPVDEALAAAGDVVVELATGAADCAGTAFCAAGGAADGGAAVCGAGVCASGAAAEPDCGAGVELDCAGGGAGGGGGGFGCFTSDGGGSSCVSGGVVFCGGEDCAEHGRSVAKAAQSSTANRKRARYTVNTLKQHESPGHSCARRTVHRSGTHSATLARRLCAEPACSTRYN